jgi:hypothetical protein
VRGIVGLLGAAILALSATAAALATGVNGTWQGRFIYPQEIGNIPASAYPTAKLVVGSVRIHASFTGRTQAAHDPENATSTCSMQFRFRQTTDGWRLYRQVGKAELVGSSSGGVPDLSPCSSGSGGALRVRSVSARKLTAEFTSPYRADEGFGAGRFRALLQR